MKAAVNGSPEHRLSVLTFQHRSIRVAIDPSRLLSSLADEAFADEPEKLHPFLRLAFAPEGERVNMTHVIDGVKLDSVTIDSFMVLSPVEYVFQVVALVDCQCLCAMSPVPILFTTTTTIDKVKEQYLRVWKLHQLIEAEEGVQCRAVPRSRRPSPDLDCWP